jgi:hypothetical protein
MEMFMRRAFTLLLSCCVVACSSSKTTSPDAQPDPGGGQPDAAMDPPMRPDLAADNTIVNMGDVAADPAGDAPFGPEVGGGRDSARDTPINSDSVFSNPDLGREGASSSPEVGRDLGSEAGAVGGASGRASVLQHHNHASRDGFYVDSALSKSAMAGLHVDPAFAQATTAGPTYTQPLYLAGESGGRDLVIVATEQNHVYAFDAATGGKPVWDQLLGTPLPKSRLATLRTGCGNIDPLGITGTPVIDPATRTIYLDAMLIASANATAQHQVFALDADTGKVKQGWPVDLNTTVKVGNTTFNSLVQNQRGALALLGGKVFVPFGGHIGDCADYHGWIVGISTEDPSQVSAWVTRTLAGGVWAPGGIATDGQSIYFATGNTENQANTFTAPADWSDGEAIFRLPPSLTFSGKSTDYFAPTNWAALDNADTDIGGSGPIIVDVPGATPSALVIGLGKDGNAYLVDRSNMGGISKPVVLASVATGTIINAAAAYTTPNGSYVVFKGNGKGCPAGQSGGLAAFKIAPASPPTVTMAWCGGPSTQDSP